MSHPRSVRFPDSLAQAAEKRAVSLGYPNWAAYIKGLVRYDLLVQGDHPVTVPMAVLPPVKQDAVDDHLLILTKKGLGERGQLLKRILERVKDPARVGNVLAGSFN